MKNKCIGLAIRLKHNTILMNFTKKTPSNFHDNSFSGEVLFLQPANSDLYGSLCEGFRFLERHPEVLGLIEDDQDTHGLLKKKVRVLDRISEQEMCERLEFIDLPPTSSMVGFRENHCDDNLLYAEKQQVHGLMDIFSDSISDMLAACECCYKRIFDEVKVDNKDKILSLSDSDAAFIIKGGRETVLGYKPQIAVSDNMFVTSVIVPEGNAADSDMLTLCVDDVMARTGVTPKLISTDDGYVSLKNQEELKAQGIGTVSFGGSKGKKLLEDEWDKEEFVNARNDRSKAESIMFSLKHLFDFGQLQRRSIDAVRTELTMKSVIYNFYHIMKKRKDRDDDMLLLAA